MLRAVTFDYWGTLVDATHSNSELRVAYLGRHLPWIEVERLRRAYDHALGRFFLAIDTGFNLGAAAVLSLTLDSLGEALPPQVYAATLRFWQEAVLTSPPPFLDGALDVLARLRQRGFLVGLVSDTGVTPGTVMRRLFYEQGVLPLFDWLTFSDQIGVTKRHPQAFALTLKALGVSPAEALHVGDLLETDIRGAKAVGMRAALLLQNRGRREDTEEAIVEADIVLERLADLLGHV